MWRWYKPEPKSKYKNHRVNIDGMTFDSEAEFKRWGELRTMERCGEIKDLQRQVPFELIPNVKKKDGHIVRKVVYIADFVYIENGEEVVEDVKGMRTDVYKLKKKLMLWRYGIEIREVQA